MQKPQLAKYYGEPFDLIEMGDGRAIAKLRQQNRPLFSARRREKQSYHKLYVCSPLSAPTQEGIKANMHRAQQYMIEVSELYGCRAIAPHGYLPYLLDDHQANERAMAMAFGEKLLFLCDAIVACGNRITRGMAEEIRHATAHRTPVLLCPSWEVVNWSVEL